MLCSGFDKKFCQILVACSEWCADISYRQSATNMLNSAWSGIWNRSLLCEDLKISECCLPHIFVSWYSFISLLHLLFANQFVNVYFISNYWNKIVLYFLFSVYLSSQLQIILTRQTQCFRKAKYCFLIRKNYSFIHAKHWPKLNKYSFLLRYNQLLCNFVDSFRLVNNFR